MSSLVKTQLKWMRFSGAAADDMTNTIYTWSDTHDAMENAERAIPAIRENLAEPYGGAYCNEDLFLGTLQFTSWDVTDQQAPILVDDGAFTPTADVQKVPTEVACCLSFQAQRVAGLKQARRRGRIYLPCPADEVIITGSQTVWTSTYVAAVCGYAENMKDAMLAVDIAWSVFSPTIYAIDASIFAAHSLVLDGWVDNEPDTQRRRGLRRGTKTTWTS